MMWYWVVPVLGVRLSEMGRKRLGVGEKILGFSWCGGVKRKCGVRSCWFGAFIELSMSVGVVWERWEGLRV